MVDDYSTHEDEPVEREFDPNAITHDADTADNNWLESNVSPKVDEWVGKTIGQFQIIQIIGSGGMGNVYEARQMHPNRSVALKIVKSAAATPITLQRFEMESEMLARFQHPGIAQVYDSGHQMQGDILLPFFVMEYVLGSRSITDYAEDEHLSREGRLELLLLVFNAVQYGHGRGVIHRDLKPSNILITTAGMPKVIDFGVALRSDSDEIETTITSTGRFVGTLQWASPEQCGDDPHDVDIRTDVYSLGVIMYQLIVGELPYSMKGIPLYRAPIVVRETKPVPPRSIDPTIPVDVEQIIAKALRKDRKLRYESVAELAMDVRRFLSNEPIHAKPPSKLRQLKLYAKRNQLKFKAGIVVFLALILGVTGLVWGLVESEKRSKELQRLYVTAKSATRTAERRAYTATIGAAQVAIANNSWLMARHHLDSTDRGYRGWEWNYLRRFVDHSIGVWPVGDRPNILATSPNGESVAVAFEGVRIGIIDEKREVLRTIQMSDRVSTLAFTGDGALLVVGMSNGVIAIVDTKDNTLLAFTDEVPSVESIAPTNSDYFATGHSDGIVRIWKTDGTLLRTINTGNGTILSIAYDSTGTQLAIGKTDGVVQIWNESRSEFQMHQEAHEDAVYDLIFLENGKLVSVGGDGVMEVWDPDTKNLLNKIQVNSDAIFSVTEVDGTVATAGQDGIIRIWSTSDFALLDELVGHDDWIWSIESVGDNRLASVSRDGDIRWWSSELLISSTARTLGKLPASDIAFVFDAKLAVVSEFDSDVQLLDFVTGESKILRSVTNDELTIVKHVPTTSMLVTGDVRGNVRLWDTDLMLQTSLVGICDGQISSLAVSEFGKFIAAGTLSGGIYVWDMQSNQLVLDYVVSNANVLSMTFGSKANTIFVSTSRDAVIALAIKPKQELWRKESSIDVMVLEYLSNSNVLLAASPNNTIELLDVSDGSVLQTANAKGATLRDVAVFPDENRFVTVLTDGTVSVWDASFLYLIASFSSSESADCIGVSSDGTIVSVGGGGSEINFMDGLSRNARLIKREQ
jgi:eukaryotic-like serine/threonine-protein kinase